MRYSYATVSLPSFTPDQAIIEASAAGFLGLEWKVGEAPHAKGSSAERFLINNMCTLAQDASEAVRLSERSKDAHMNVVGLCPYVEMGDLTSLDEILDLAIAIGAPQIRLQGPRLSGSDSTYRQLFAHFLDFLVDASRMATARGIRLELEIHQNTILPSASLAQRIVSYFDPADVGVIYDVGNLVFEGFEDYRIATELLGVYLHHVHLKNAKMQAFDERSERVVRHKPMWSPLDDGVVDVRAALGHLDKIGYDGWVSIEDLSTDRSPSDTLQHNAKLLSRWNAPGWTGGVPYRAVQN